MRATLVALSLLGSLLLAGPPSSASGAADLGVDTDRNGVVDGADEAGEDVWTPTRGAIFTVNYDDDDSDGVTDSVAMSEVDGVPAVLDTIVNGPTDAVDITPLVIRIPFAREQVAGAVLSGDARAVHVFPRIEPGAERIWGGPGSPATVDITEQLADGVETTFGLEGLFFRWTMPGAYGGTFPDGFDGTVSLRLEVTLTDGAVHADDVVLKVAPFIVTPNTQPAIETFEFRADGLVPGSSGTGGPNQWTQDHVEMGYTQAPGRPPQPVVFRLPYFRGQGVSLPTWPQRDLLGPDTGTFLLRRDFGAGSGDYGGNLQVLPPTLSRPLGRILVGSTMSDAMYGFLRDQEVQDAFPKDTVDTSWLAVGHVDEMFGFVPDGDSSTVVYADPQLAFSMLDGDFSDDGVFFATGRTTANHGLVASGMLPNALLDADADLRSFPFARYLRIYDGTGKGQVARIAPDGLTDGRVTIDRVWQPPSALLGPAASAASRLGCEVPCTDQPVLVNSAGTWFIPPDATSRYVLFEGTKHWIAAASFPERLGLLVLDGAPSAVSVREVREDPGLRTLNDLAHRKVQDAIAAISAAMGDEAPRFAGLPDIFMNIVVTGGTLAVAMTPGAVNLQPVDGVTYVPQDFGPADVDGVLAFEETIAERIPGPETFVDDWDLYHRLLGEVHCGTNVRREPFAHPWW